MKKIIWKTIQINPKYEVSNLGDVRNIKTQKILKPQIKPNGYSDVDLNMKDIRKCGMYIHRLVALAFIPNPYNKPNVNHKDLNKQNNTVDNLEWVTQKENVQHYFKNRRK